MIDPDDSNPCSPENVRATPLIINVTLDDGIAGQFLTGMASQDFSLEPGQVGNINAMVKTLLVNLQNYTADALYGLQVHIHAHYVDTDGVDHDLDDELPATDIYIYRLLDIADNNHTDGKIAFVKTFDGDGDGGIIQPLQLNMIMADAPNRI